MFTGLIEAVGRLDRLERGGTGASVSILHEPFDAALRAGDSVAVQGACLTVTCVAAHGFTCDVLEETLVRTNLTHTRHGAALNLERALRLNDRLGGHLVTGHVDGVGEVESISREERDYRIRIKADPALCRGIVLKGSVACDGVSLTVTEAGCDRFAVNVIPYTWEHTSLGERRAGDPLNLETDMIGKYVARYLETAAGSDERLLAALQRSGFPV